MTIAQAEALCSTVPDVVASKGSSGFCRRSQLGNWSMVDIAKAFALMIARNRQLVAHDKNARRLCKEYAEKAAALLVSLRMIVISDSDADNLSRLERNSDEYNEARQKIVIGLLEDKSPEWQRFLKLESLEAFNDYCWTLEPDDPQYWDRVHERLKLPYQTRSAAA
jgi:hypothetical protein